MKWLGRLSIHYMVVGWHKHPFIIGSIQTKIGVIFAEIKKKNGITQGLSEQ
jgi:hypothetical protein